MKKRLILVSLSVIIGLIGFRALPAKAGVNDFSFKSFEADYYLSRDDQKVAQLKVVEKFTPVFPDYDQNHGMLRAIPEQYKNHNLNLKVLSVTDATGTPRAFKEESSNRNRLVSIRQDSFVHGEQTYVITYTQRDIMTLYPGDHDEWYWDTIGDQWAQPFGSVVARIHIPAEFSTSLQPTQKCFTGGYGSSASDCTIIRSQDTDGTLVTVSANQSLNSRENMSFVLGFVPTTFTMYRRPLSELMIILALAFAIFVFPPLLALIVMVRRWLKLGRDARGRGVIVAQYTPPKDVNPLMADMILHETMSVKAISASILDMCIRGVMKLYEVETKKLIGKSTNYELELVSANVGSLSPQEEKIIGLLFDQKVPGARAKLKDLSNKLYTGAATLSAEVSKLAASRGYFVGDPRTVVGTYVGVGILLMLAGSLPLIFGHLVWFLGVGVAGIVVLLIGKVMPARTVKGVEVKEHLEGLKLYMKMAEADRIKMLQSPEGVEKTPVQIDTNDPTQLVKLYEKLLPYAVLYGMEKEWAEQFANLYNQPPGWYSGNSAFNAIAFSHAVGGFNSAAATSFSPPSSSGSSGFGGGGFSGGGGGGGGGGGL